jgi:hypothetical protein
VEYAPDEDVDEDDEEESVFVVEDEDELCPHVGSKGDRPGGGGLPSSSARR